MTAPHGFLWGVATSSYQVEGYPLADGGGPCIWHEFAHTAGNTARGETGDVACDHYHRYAEDVALMRRMGVGAYRLSLRWPRVVPDGVGTDNERGWEFYDRLIDALAAVGIRPFVTLYHWDLPVALQDRGGWLSPDMPAWFADYATRAARRLGDRVQDFITLNEPWVTAEAGHVAGRAAPGLRNAFAGMRAVEIQILAHRAAYRALKAEHADLNVGLTLSNTWHRPESANDADRAAAERANAYVNYPLFLDPLLRGAYPPPIADAVARLLPRARPEATAAPAGPPPLDFVGVNYYASQRVTADARAPFGYRTVPHPELPATAMGWTIDADGFGALLADLAGHHPNLTAYVTENGAAFDDTPSPDGVHDPERIAYLEAHIAQAVAARRAGLDLRGYFVWSLLDNYEWTHGYARRFGLVYVDRATLDRTLKDSGHWYARVCRGEQPDLRP
jgi:beta-glucosidase